MRLHCLHEGSQSCTISDDMMAGSQDHLDNADRFLWGICWLICDAEWCSRSCGIGVFFLITDHRSLLLEHHFHVGFTIRGILCQVHDHMYCWEPLFPWYCADTESLRFRIRHNLGWVRKVTCQRSLELGFQKVTLEFLGLIRKISHLPLGRSTCFEGYLWMWPRLEEHDYVSFIGKGSGLNIVCIYPTSYILTQPNSRILIFW